MISVCIPCYNQGEFLPDAIESALLQSKKPHEIIVVNDGSLDHTLDIARSYEKDGVKVINQVNKGLAGARNAAIMAMTGDYFLPLDADDMLMENCIEKMETAISEWQPDVIAPSFKEFGVRNQAIILNYIPSLKDFAEANRLGYFSAIKKTVLQEVGGYSPRMTWGYEDYHLWIDIFKRKHSLCILQEPLVLYRTKEESMLTVARAHHNELIDQIVRDHPELYA